jgi:hypothetical protein
MPLRAAATRVDAMSNIGDWFTGKLLNSFGRSFGMTDAKQLSEVALNRSQSGALRFRFMKGDDGIFAVLCYSTGPFERNITVIDPEDTKRLARAMTDAYLEYESSQKR